VDCDAAALIFKVFEVAVEADVTFPVFLGAAAVLDEFVSLHLVADLALVVSLAAGVLDLLAQEAASFTFDGRDEPLEI